jgi:hypothetical protein
MRKAQAVNLGLFAEPQRSRVVVRIALGRMLAINLEHTRVALLPALN